MVTVTWTDNDGTVHVEKHLSPSAARDLVQDLMVEFHIPQTRIEVTYE